MRSGFRVVEVGGEAYRVWFRGEAVTYVEGRARGSQKAERRWRQLWWRREAAAEPPGRGVIGRACAAARQDAAPLKFPPRPLRP